MAKKGKIMGLVESMTGLGKDKGGAPESVDQELTDIPGAKVPMPIGWEECRMTDPLFELYVARVGAVDLIHTARTDKRKMFAEALTEAEVALEVFREKHPGVVMDQLEVEPGEGE